MTNFQNRSFAIVCIIVYLLTIHSTSAIIALTSSSSSPQSAQNIQNAHINNCFWQQNSICIECNFGFFIKDQTCTRGKNNCKTFDSLSGECLTCFVGSSINNGSCENDSRIDINQGCAKMIENKCVECSAGYYFNFQNNCQLIDTLCRTFDYYTKTCSECYTGHIYKINLRKCVGGANQRDSKCLEWNNRQCLTCIYGYYLLNSICVSSNPYCLQLNSQNISRCVKCGYGYIVYNDSCALNFSNYLTQDLCSEFSVNNTCLRCGYSSFLNPLGVCIPINPLCLSYNLINGFCQKCFGGYYLLNGTCVLKSYLTSNPLCSIWNDKKCMSCAPWSFINKNGKCEAVDTLCQTFDSDNGLCTSCYGGYILNNGSCLINAPKMVNYCAVYSNAVCTQCYGGYYLDVNSVCKLANPNCLTSTNRGQCSNCYDGYIIWQGNCIINSISFCTQLQSPTRCAVCQPEYYSSLQKDCRPIPLNCKDVSILNDSCVQCNTKFKLINGVCYENIDFTNNNPFCSKWQKSGEICLECAYNSFFNSSGYCIPTNPYCQQYDRNSGECLRCYKGYHLFNQTCQINVNNCLSVDSLGLCISCYKGYYLKDAVCIMDDPFCHSFNYETFICDECSIGYHVVKSICSPI